ncbi:putative gnat family [Phaeomoniella chlamydospora]|uniref:Putative gnat family n=1 Tax=Phaeomoniella chlamydospora TaxID=158046 RepID=A0A0G2ERS4_PHACM|nr:putative gnat family [Phaeomoniella chlamydospora]
MPFTPSATFYLSTPRLYISHLLPVTHPHHSEFICTLYNSELFVSTCGKTSVNSPEKAKSHIEGWIACNFEKNGFGCYLISLRDRTSIVDSKGDKALQSDETELKPGDVPIGITTLMRGNYTVPDIGFALLPEYTGKGYATEAGKRVIQFAAHDPVEQGGLGLEGVFGFTDPTNMGSRKICERLGLVDYGVYPLEAFGGKESAVYCSQGMVVDGEGLKKFGIMGDKIEQ